LVVWWRTAARASRWPAPRPSTDQRPPNRAADRDAVLIALDGFDKGLDFADAMHMARSSRACGFATFDQRLAKRAEGLVLAPPVELLV